MKSVMISIQPKWCKLIACGKKTIEVRKTRPSCNVPFKCYIYETKNGGGSGKVIGEFVCDKIIEYPYVYDGYCSSYGYFDLTRNGLDKMCLEYSDLETYGDGKTLFGWYISHFHIYNKPIYNKPKELSDFIHPVSLGCVDQGKCLGCKFFNMGNDWAGIENDCLADFDTNDYEILKRPPQSWCYVELL